MDGEEKKLSLSIAPQYVKKLMEYYGVDRKTLAKILKSKIYEPLYETTPRIKQMLLREIEKTRFLAFLYTRPDLLRLIILSLPPEVARIVYVDYMLSGRPMPIEKILSPYNVCVEIANRFALGTEICAGIDSNPEKVINAIDRALARMAIAPHIRLQVIQRLREITSRRGEE